MIIAVAPADPFGGGVNDLPPEHGAQLVRAEDRLHSADSALELENRDEI